MKEVDLFWGSQWPCVRTIKLHVYIALNGLKLQGSGD